MAATGEEAQIGVRIRLVRKEHGISRRLAAQEIGLSRQQLDRIERGEVAIRLYPGLSFCEFAAINPLWLAFGEPEKRFGCPDEEWLEAALALDVEHRRSADPKFLDFMKRSKERFRRVSPLYTFNREPEATKKRLGMLRIKHYLTHGMTVESPPRTWDELRSMFASSTRSPEAKKDIAKRLGVTLAAISQWRSGASAPTADNALRILDWIGEAVVRFPTKSAGMSEAPARKRSKARRKSKREKQPSKDRKPS